MTGVTRAQGRRRARGERRERAEFAVECLGRLVRILVRCGHSPRDLARAVRAICRPLDEPPSPWDPGRLHLDVDLAHVISLWYSDPRYLDATGTPRELSPKGRTPSLESLIKRVLPGEAPSAVTRALAQMHCIRRRNGRYSPTGRFVALRENSARIRSLSALMGILRTVERNVTGKKSLALLERNASHPSFPVAALPGFHDRLKDQADDFLRDIDTDMLRRERRFRGGRKTRLGVEIFAFEEPLPKRRRNRLSLKALSPLRARKRRKA